MQKEDYITREAVSTDIPALAQLQVTTFNDAYPSYPQPPTILIREWQWTEQFKVDPEHWFCVVAENTKKELVGFAKGLRYDHSDLPAYNGELNKMYVLKNYQRQGIAKQLFKASVNRFKKMKITSFVVFGEGRDIANAFYEKMGGSKLFAKNGEFHGGYGWINF